MTIISNFSDLLNITHQFIKEFNIVSNVLNILKESLIGFNNRVTNTNKVNKSNTNNMTFKVNNYTNSNTYY